MLNVVGMYLKGLIAINPALIFEPKDICLISYYVSIHIGNAMFDLEISTICLSSHWLLLLFLQVTFGLFVPSFCIFCVLSGIIALASSLG